MRIYEGSPRQDFEEVFRSIGAFLDQRGMRDVLLLEAPDGFIVQGLVVVRWRPGDVVGVDGHADQGDADLPRRRHRPVHGGSGRRRGTGAPAPPAGHYEAAFRVIGRYMDDQKPRDVFFFEQEGAFVLRLLDERPGRQQARARRVHPGRHHRHDRPRPEPAAHRQDRARDRAPST